MALGKDLQQEGALTTAFAAAPEAGGGDGGSSKELLHKLADARTAAA